MAVVGFPTSAGHFTCAKHTPTVESGGVLCPSVWTSEFAASPVSTTYS